MSIVQRVRAWWQQLFACQHPASARDYRFRWIGEWAEYYEECTRCGKEFLS